MEERTTPGSDYFSSCITLAFEQISLYQLENKRLIELCKELRNRVGNLETQAEQMESMVSYTGNPIEQFMLNNKLSLTCPFSIIYDSEGFGGGHFNDEPEEEQYKFICDYAYGNASFKLIDCTDGKRANQILVGLLNGEYLVHKRL